MSADREAGIIPILEAACLDPRIPRGYRQGRYLLGLFVQDGNLGWGVQLVDGDLTWVRGFPPEARNRLIFRNPRDFHRFASGVPWRWLALRRRVRYRGSNRVLGVIRNAIVRANKKRQRGQT